MPQDWQEARRRKTTMHALSNLSHPACFLVGRLAAAFPAQNEVLYRNVHVMIMIQRKALQLSLQPCNVQNDENFPPSQARRAPKQENAVKNQEM